MPAPLKERVHEDLQDGLRELSQFEGGYVVKWVLVAEVALPDSSHTLVKMDSSADGRDLFSWERTGLLRSALETKVGRP